MSLQEPQEQFEREQAEPTRGILRIPQLQSPLSDSDTLTSSSNSESVDVPTEEITFLHSDDFLGG